MGTIVGAVTACVLIAGIAFYRSGGRRRRPPQPSSAADRPRGKHDRNRFKGVQIKPGSNACEAVRRLERQRFLARNPPRLPLADCTSDHCRCSFSKLPDRREEPRRWSDHGVEPPIYAAEERRRAGDRRRTRDRRERGTP